MFSNPSSSRPDHVDNVVNIRNKRVHHTHGQRNGFEVSYHTAFAFAPGMSQSWKPLPAAKAAPYTSIHYGISTVNFARQIKREQFPDQTVVIYHQAEDNRNRFS